MRKFIFAFCCLVSVANAAIYTETFEQFPHSTTEFSFWLGDRLVWIEGAKAESMLPGPPAWEDTYLTPHAPCSDEIEVYFNPPVYAVTVQVTSTLGDEYNPPIVVASSDYVLSGWTFTSGPGVYQMWWPHNKIWNAGAGYAFIAGSEDVPIIDEITIYHGDLGKLQIQTHPLTSNQRLALRLGLPFTVEPESNVED